VLQELLSNEAVKAVVGLVILPAILTGVLIAVVLFIQAITRARRDIEEQEPLKYMRYEAGNPVKKGEARGKVSMQYLGYLIIFLAVEPAVVLLAILLAAPRSYSGILLELFAIMIGVYAPLLAYALREARRIESWMIEG